MIMGWQTQNFLVDPFLCAAMEWCLLYALTWLTVTLFTQQTPTADILDSLLPTRCILAFTKTYFLRAHRGQDWRKLYNEEMHERTRNIVVSLLLLQVVFYSYQFEDTLCSLRCKQHLHSNSKVVCSSHASRTSWEKERKKKCWDLGYSFNAGGSFLKKGGWRVTQVELRESALCSSSNTKRFSRGSIYETLYSFS